MCSSGVERYVKVNVLGFEWLLNRLSPYTEFNHNLFDRLYALYLSTARINPHTFKVKSKWRY